MRRIALLLSAFVFTLALLPAQPVPPALFQEMRWRMIGPFRGGRTPIATGARGQPNVFYMGANNGGVWKSTDYGNVWRPIFDDQPTGSIGALAVAPSDPNIIYAGSGEGLQRPDLSVGDGVYKSLDAGRTWRNLGLRDGQQISAIIVDPGNANRVFVAVLGHPYGPNEVRGVFSSTDGGQTWQKVLYKDENTGAVDLAFDPKNPQKVFAVLWAARQFPWEAGANGPGSGLFVSTDGGNNWRPLFLGLPAPQDGLGRIGIGVAPSDPRRVYAWVEAPPRFGGIYRSDDGGENWRRVNSENRIYGRGSDFSCVRVDPKNPDIVYVANTSTYRSTNAGETFTAFKGAPGGDDYHSVWINPDDGNVILLGSDQGATLTVNGGQTWSSWDNQPTAHFYHVITDNRFPYWVYGGQQESGSVGTASRSDYGEITFRDWHPVGVEEDGYVAPDPPNPHIIYGGKATRYNMITGDVQNIAPTPLRGRGKYRFVRTMPIIFSYVDPHILYLASNVLFKTINGGQSWEIISPDLTRESYPAPPSMGIFAALDPEKGKHRGVIYAVAPSRKDVNMIWAGTDDGLVHVTRDAGKTWKNITPADLTPWSKVSQLDASHFDTETVYAAINRFRLDDLHPHVYRTHDGGRTWKKIVDGIPDNEVVNTVREDPVRKGLLFAGTERAVYVSFDDGDHWQTLRLNMPATSIRDLVVHQDDVVVGTHGRSFWILDDITPLRQVNAQLASAGAYLFKPQLTYRVARNRNTDPRLPPEEPAGQNPPDGAILDYYLKAKPSGPITLAVFDHLGKSVRRFSSDDQPEPVGNDLNVPTYWVRPPHVLPAEPGMHRWIWDLRYRPPDALSHTYPISAIYQDTPRYPLGPRVMPGQYLVKLTVDGKTYSQPLTVKMDPRNKTPLPGLTQQFTLSRRAYAAMNEDYAALQELRKVRAQLRERRQKAGSGGLADKIAALDQKAAALEDAGSSESLPRLNGELSSILGILQGSDSTPTAQAAKAVTELRKALDTQLAKWKALKASVAALP